MSTGYAKVKEEAARWRREKAQRRGRVMTLLSQDGVAAVRGLGASGKPVMAITSGEMSYPVQGRQRASFFFEDGPYSHSIRNWDEEIAEVIAEELTGGEIADIEPMTEDAVMAWTSTPEFQLGSRVVAFVQAENALRYFAQKGGRYEWAAGVIRHANDVGTNSGEHRGTIESLDAALEIVTSALRTLPAPNPHNPRPLWDVYVRGPDGFFDLGAGPAYRRIYAQGAQEAVDYVRKVMEREGHKIPADAALALPADFVSYEVGQSGARKLVDNPPWVTKLLADSYEVLEARVPPAWLPRLSDTGRAGGSSRRGCASTAVARTAACCRRSIRPWSSRSRPTPRRHSSRRTWRPGCRRPSSSPTGW